MISLDERLYSPHWEVLARGDHDAMRDLAERLGPQIDRYAIAAGVKYSAKESGDDSRT